MIDEDFKTKIKAFSNKEILEQIDFMTEGYYSDLIEICLEELRCRLEATEWHYPSKGEYPTEGKTVFATFQEGGLWYFAEAEYHEGGWASSIVDLGNIVAWQYIIPPKIENLKCHAKVTIKAADNNNIEGERKNDKL